jgi:hypothetical protein
MDLLARVERDTLGLDASLPRCLHADVLEACDRALERSLAAQARSADAPRAPDAPAAPGAAPALAGGGSKEPPAPPPRAAPPGPITAAQLAQARAVARACLPAAPLPQAAQEERAIAAAEAAWLAAAHGGGGGGGAPRSG